GGDEALDGAVPSNPPRARPSSVRGPPQAGPAGRHRRGAGQGGEGEGTREEKKKKKKKEKAVPPNCQRLTVNNSAPGHGEAQMPLGHSKAGRRSRYTDQGSAHVARGS
ncbi:unnamed protein product, partial [Prorocentrum cordatum]